MPPGQARGLYHERRVFLASHPLGTAIGALARNVGPVISIPVVGHIVSDVTLGREVLAQPERFSKTGPGAVGAIMTQVMGPHCLLNMDGPDHKVLRQKLQGLFTKTFVDQIVGEVFQTPLQRLRDQLERGEAVDLARLAQILTGRMVCAMLGIELDEADADATCLRLYRTGVELASVVSLAERRLSPARLDFARGRFDELTLHARAAYERGDEKTVLGRLKNLGLTFEESRGVVGILFLAGTETTASSLPSITALLVDTGQWRDVRADRTLLPRAIDEGLRRTTPVPLMTRSVAQDTVLGGRKLAKDDRLIVFMHNLCRSPEVYENPLVFDIHREHPRAMQNLWFGNGPHFCLGFSLSRKEIAQTLETLLDVGELEIVSRRYGRKVLFPAYAELRVRRAR